MRVFGLMLCLLSASWLHAEALMTLPQGAVLIGHESVSISDQEHQRAQEQWSALLGDSSVILQSKQHTLKSSVALANVQSEWLRGLQPMHLTEKQRMVLQQLAKQKDLVWRQHPETASAWFVPAFDIQTQAQSLLMQKEDAKAADAWLAQWRSKSSSRDVSLASMPERVRDRALNQLTVNELTRLSTEPLPHAIRSAVLFAKAVKQPNQSTFDEAWQQTDGAHKLRLLRQSQLLPAQNRLLWLGKVAQDNAFTAMAWSLQAESMMLANQEQRQIIQSEWQKGLNHSETAAAASLALSALPDELRHEWLAESWQKAQSDLAKKHLLLALRLDDSPQADALRATWQQETSR